MVKYGLIMKAWQPFLVSPIWKINITSLMIPQWNQPSTCIPKMVSSNFAGLQRPKYKTGTIMVQMLDDNKSFFTDHQVS